MNWNYIAGFFDGEGSLTRYKNGFRIFITQTNKEILKSIQSFSKVGNIFEVTKRKPHWKDCWMLSITNHKDAHYFLEKISSRLVIKRELADEARRIIKNNIVEMERKKTLVIKRKEKAKELRKRGLSYRQIGKELGIDWGYVRRLVLGIK